MLKKGDPTWTLRPHGHAKLYIREGYLYGVPRFDILLPLMASLYDYVSGDGKSPASVGGEVQLWSWMMVAVVEVQHIPIR